MKYPNTWIRIAGTSRRIKENLPPPHWRFQIGGSPEQMELVGWELLGTATKENNRQGTNPQAKSTEMIAWVEFFGDVELDDKKIAHITLKNPSLTHIS